jgi:hypothetical protein
MISWHYSLRVNINMSHNIGAITPLEKELVDYFDVQVFSTVYIGS